MPTALRNRLPDPIPSLGEFEGVINTRREKNLGYTGLVVGRNVEVTNEKRLLRRAGYQSAISGPFSGAYGAQTQHRLLTVHNGDLSIVGPDFAETVLTSGLLDGLYCWDEDPANNVYYTSSNGSNGIVMADGVWRPLYLPVPTILSVAVVTTAPWTVTPFNLGKTYNVNMMQLFATYVYPDGRESAPSEIVTVSVAPEVQLLQALVPVQAECTTLVYATAPGGTKYFLVAQSTAPSFTFPVFFLNKSYTGTDYAYSTVLDSFPVEAFMLAFTGGRLFAGAYDPTVQLGVVYPSLHMQYHLFNKTDDFIMVSGPPLLLLPCKEGMIIGTDTNIYLWKEPTRYEHQIGMKGGSLDVLAEYGVPPGICGDTTMEGKACFWTLRGVARAMPYELVTEATFSADPGVFNSARIFYEHGYAKLVASTIAGNPVWNAWSAR